MSGSANNTGMRGASGLIPSREAIRRQVQLSWRKTIEMAWRNIRVRPGRSLLVTSGIVLAVAFLSSMLVGDVLGQAVMRDGPAELLRVLEREGRLTVDDPDARIQTWWMVGLAMLVSFVGVLNAMLLSVAERFAEIGTMKCLGAMDRLIVRLFLIESVCQGLVGSTAGVAAGVALAVLRGLADYGWAGWSLMPWRGVLSMAGVCLAAGMGITIAGALYPASRAAKMKPVDAMRLEV